MNEYIPNITQYVSHCLSSSVVSSVERAIVLLKIGYTTPRICTIYVEIDIYRAVIKTPINTIPIASTPGGRLVFSLNN